MFAWSIRARKRVELIRVPLDPSQPSVWRTSRHHWAAAMFVFLDKGCYASSDLSCLLPTSDVLVERIEALLLLLPLSLRLGL